MLHDKYTIEVHAIDWTIILTRLLAKHNPKDGNDVTVTLTPDGQTAIYSISRNFIASEEIAQAIGSTAEHVELASKIVLEPIYTPTVWQTPTVDYIGTA